MSSLEADPAPALPRAVALRYDASGAAGRDDVPRVVAAGQGRLAEAILALAREHGVAVRSDPDLVALLATCEPGAPIPTELYTAVAELLVWLVRTNAALDDAGAPSEGGAAPG
jgi:flagellar biosynthesis protein